MTAEELLPWIVCEITTAMQRLENVGKDLRKLAVGETGCKGEAFGRQPKEIRDYLLQRRDSIDESISDIATVLWRLSVDYNCPGIAEGE